MMKNSISRTSSLDFEKLKESLKKLINRINSIKTNRTKHKTEIHLHCPQNSTFSKWVYLYPGNDEKPDD